MLRRQRREKGRVRRRDDEREEGGNGERGRS
jgi:hypothetical protein